MGDRDGIKTAGQKQQKNIKVTVQKNKQMFKYLSIFQEPNTHVFGVPEMKKLITEIFPYLFKNMFTDKEANKPQVD